MASTFYFFPARENDKKKSTIDYNAEQLVSSRPPTLLPTSNRTLNHPSFLPLYVASDFTHHHTNYNNQTVHPIIPAEFFYSDPTMSCGRRIPNLVSSLRVFDNLQLNTPPPVMSICPATPTCADPFRSGPQRSMVHSSLFLKVNPLQAPSVKPHQAVTKDTQEENQAFENLTLHHQEPAQSDETRIAPQMDLDPVSVLCYPEPVESISAEEVFKHDVQHLREASWRDQLQHGRCWSHTELEAAHTLLSHFSPMEKDNARGRHQDKSAATRPDAMPYQSQGSGFRGFVERKDPDDGYLPVHEVCPAPSLPLRPPSGRGDLSEVTERIILDSEGDAVHVLLSLGDMLDTMQS